VAHEISNKNFFDASGKPAWHRLSIFEKLGIEREDRPYTAKEVYALFGRPEYETRPVFYQNSAGELVPLHDDELIVRLPIEDDPQERIIGRVSDHYELVSGHIAARDWDEHVRLPVATSMLLRDYGVLVITSELPSYDVKGEEITNYIIYSHGMNGRNASRVDIDSTRVVCANTLRAAQSRSTRNIAGAYENLIAWMENIADEAIYKNEMMRDVYNILAETPVTDEDARAIADVAFPDPIKPRKDYQYANGYDLALENWQSKMERAADRRLQIVQGFTQASAIGFDDDDCKTRGTAWHALNSATQILTHYGPNSDPAATSLLIGNRDQRIKMVTNMAIRMSDDAMNTMQDRLEKVPVPAINS